MENDFLAAAMGAFEGATVSDDVINWDDVDSELSGKKKEPLPKGVYNLIVDTAELTESPKGSKQIKFVYKVIDSNRLIWDNVTYKDYPGYVKPEKAKTTPSKMGLARIRAFIEIAGLDLDTFKFNDCWKFVGTKFTANVDIDTYNPEKPKNKVTKIEKPKGQAAAKLDF
jgi:hypothetical protein